MDYGLLGIFTAGVVTFATPCVLPLIPIYLSALIGSDIRGIKSQGRGLLLLRAVLFSIGFIAVFTMFGLTASSIGNVLSEYKPQIMIAGAVLILLFSLKFLEFISIPFFDKIVKFDDTKMTTRFGFFNAFIMGIVFAAGWSPCVGPVLGSVLTYTASATSTPVEGALYLSIYGAGFAVPLLLTAIFAEAGIRFLKKINPYLPKIEKAIGALLLFVSLSMFSGAFGSYQPHTSCNSTEDEKFHELALDDNPIMVEFYSKDCTVCKNMEPVVNSISNQCDGNMVRVRKIDISLAENSKYVRQYNLVGVPTFLFINKEGNELARLIGEQSESTLKQSLSALRGLPCPGLGQIEVLENELSFPVQDSIEDTAMCPGNKNNESSINAQKCDKS